MTGLASGLVLAGLASLGLNASYLMQHAGSRMAPALTAKQPIASLRALLGSRWWLAGSVAGATGWALYIAALAHAPLSLVQAFAAAGLVVTVPGAALMLGLRLARAELLAVLALATALALLAVGGATNPLRAVPATALTLSIAVAAAVSVALASLRSVTRRGQALGAAAGVLYGAADAATKAVTVDAHSGLAGALASPWLAVALGASVAAFACFQRGLQIGPAVPVIAVMTASANAGAILIALLAFHERLGATAGYAALHVAAFVVAGLAGLHLGISQSRFAGGADA